MPVSVCFRSKIGKSLPSQALFGLQKDLRLEVGNRYSFAASIFYIGFICGAYPAILLAQRFPLQRVVSLSALMWGTCLLATAGCTTWQGFWTQRFFLGFLEAGIPPIFMLIIGSWYTKREQAMRMGIWYSSTGYTSIVSPLINYGLGHITAGSLSPWQYMCKYLFPHSDLGTDEHGG
jgi:MFS family permease